ncbi:hypothetical protein LOK49_LG04G02378 [Camellia lanceoleosa]|uniref:Uncharacterized protein n=1 Tax=Camellia lanceoleosa TaxID=1840588 RepID=A0ACC0I3V3_9ERIC|nr:hypothetical protein LOK49_LG04G02378 [Camellia lanceoleosa]
MYLQFGLRQGGNAGLVGGSVPVFDEVVKVAAAEGAKFLNKWFVGCNASHVVCVKGLLYKNILATLTDLDTLKIILMFGLRYPDTAKFCEKPLTLADDMDILFSDVSITGEWAYTLSSGVFLDTEGSHTPLGDDTDTKIHPSELSNQCHHQNEGPSKKQKGNKKQSAAGELNKTLNHIVDAVETLSSTGTKNVTMQKPHTIIECLAKISTISSISEDDDLLVWAARLFMKPSLRESFMALPNDVLRLKFINLEIALEKARILGYRD